MHKNVLKPVKIASSQSLSASFHSTPTVFTYTDNISYQINVTTFNSTGTFQVEGSLDYVPADPLSSPGVAGHWVPLVLSGIPTVAAANDSILININECPYNSLRISYISVAGGTGTCDIFVMAKGLS
jgi:hypothetical protein